MPGIIDAHSHSMMRRGQRMHDLVTSMARIQATCSTRPTSTLYRELAGGTTALNILHGSCNAIGGQNADRQDQVRATRSTTFSFRARRRASSSRSAKIRSALTSRPSPDNRAAIRRRAWASRNVIRDAFTRARDYKRTWDEHRAATARDDKNLIPPRRTSRTRTARRNSRRQATRPRALLSRRRNPDAHRSRR